MSNPNDASTSPAGMNGNGSVRHWPEALRGWRGVSLLLVMLCGNPLLALIFASLAPALPQIAAHFGGVIDGTLLAQMIMTMPAIGLVVGGLAGGVLNDRLGPRRVVLGGLALFAAAGSVGLYLDSASILLPSRFLLGLAGACIATGATSLIGEVFDERWQRRVIGFENAMAGIAAVSALLLSGATASVSWRLPFAIYLAALPILAIAWLVMPTQNIQARPQRQADPASIFQNLWPVYVAVLLLSALMLLPSTQVPFLLQSNGLTDPVTHSRVIAFSPMFAVVMVALYGPIRNHLKARGMLNLILLGYAAGTVTLSSGDSAITAAIGCACLGFATGLFGPHFASLLVARSPAVARGRAIGAMFTVMYLGEFFQPIIFLPLRGLIGIRSAFLALGTTLTLALVILALLPSLVQLTPARKRRESDMATED